MAFGNRALRMALALLVIAAACATATAGAARKHRAAVKVSQPTSVMRGVQRLSIDLINKIGGSGNVAFSPYSIATALAMADVGARGKTAQQIEQVLGVSSQGQLTGGLGALTTDLNSDLHIGAPADQAPQLTLANGIWVSKTAQLKPRFTALLSGDFSAQAQAVDFQRAPEETREAINAWVSEHTGGLIGQLLGPGTIDSATILELVNAIYLKADWEQPFLASHTHQGSFTTARHSGVSAQFMQEHLSVPYGSGVGYRAVSLAYRGSRLSLLAVMPVGRSIGSFQRRLDTKRLQGIINSLHPADLELSIPRFHIHLQSELNGVLGELGMPLAFTEQANFSGITASPSLQISHVEHAADLRVGEQGTVAAAATGVGFEPTSARAPAPVHLQLDHPFLFFLRDDRSGLVLFAGRVSEPSDA